MKSCVTRLRIIPSITPFKSSIFLGDISGLIDLRSSQHSEFSHIPQLLLILIAKYLSLPSPSNTTLWILKFRQFIYSLAITSSHFTHLFHKCLLTVYYVPGTIVGIGNISVNKTGTIPIIFKIVSQFSSNVLFFHYCISYSTSLKKKKGCFVPAPSFFITFLNQSKLHTHGCLQSSCLLLAVKH